jgi:hypothetical protein
MRRLTITSLALAAALSTTAFAPAVEAPAEAAGTEVSGDPDPFPLGVCVMVRPVSPDRFCVYLNDPRP